MSFDSEFISLQKKKKKKENEAIAPVKADPFSEELINLQQKNIDKQLANRKKVEANGTGYFKKTRGTVAEKILGTGADVATTILQGLGNTGEGIVDLATYGVSNLSKALFGENQFSQSAKEFAQKDLVNTGAEWLGGSNGFGYNSSSVLGNKTESIAQGLGQILGMYITAGIGGKLGLAEKGVSKLNTAVLFASSTGQGMTEAYKDGATDKEAAAYGVLKGGVEAGSEAIFGGLGKGAKALGMSKGLLSADDILAKALTQKITNRVLSNAIQLGVKSTGEGLEEFAAGVGSAIAKKLTYKREKGESLRDLIKDEKLLDSFVAGAITSGIAQSGGAIKSTIKDTDLVSGLTRNEEKVLNSVYEKTIANEEKSKGKKLTSAEKNKIYEQLTKDMKRGKISTDDIESVLGGDTYTEYKGRLDQVENLQKKIDTLQKEHDELNAMKKGDMTGVQEDRLHELKKELPQLKSQLKDWTSDTKASEVADIKSRLSNEVASLVQNDRLSESYRENVRKGQHFTADLSKYTEKEAAIVKKAVDSGFLNDSNQTHDFVDLVAKLSAEKGIDFDFTTSKRLKESGFSLEGRVINGKVDGNTVTINMNSAKALESVVGHEITHILEESPDLYNAVAEAVKTYATTKGDYDSRLKELTELYKDQDADVQKELVADLVGDYIFSDADFVNSLAKGNRNLAQKILDEIKYMAKIATAGSKEKRQLEKAKKMLKDALEKSVDTKSDAANSFDKQIKHSISKTVEKAVTNKGDIEEKYNQKKISEVPHELFEMVFSASGGEIDISNKFIALNGADIYHEYKRHSDEDIEISRGQIALNKETIVDIIEAIYSPDVVECLFDNANNPTQRQSFAYAKKKDGFYVVAEAVGGKTNPNIVPVMMLYVTDEKWRRFIGAGKTIGEMLYENDPEKINALDIQKNKKNRVIAAQFVSKETIANTPHSPRFKKSLSQDGANVNTKNIFGFDINKSANVNEDLLEELSIYHPGAEVDINGNITVYHRTNKDNANKIYKSGIMTAKEDALFFSSKSSGYASDYGDTVVALKIPSTILEVNDIFDGEVHFDIPLKYKNGGFSLDVSKYLLNDTNLSLSPTGTTESGRFMGKDLLLEDEVIEVETPKAVAPVREDIAKTAKTTDTVAEENVTTESTVSVPTVEENTAIKDAINDLFKRYQWGDVENPHYENAEDDDFTDLVLDNAAEGIFVQWDMEGSIKGNALHALLDENAEYDEYGEVSNDVHLYEIIKEKLLEVVPIYKAEAEAEAEANAIDEATNLPRWAVNQIANYKEAIAEERAKAKGRKKASNVSVKRLVSQKPAKRNDGRPDSTTQGAKVLDGKQYMSYNGRFVLELNTPDESIPVNEQLAADSIKGIFEKVDKDIIEGNYNIDAIDISLIRKEVPKGTSRKNLVVVGDSYFDIDYVDAVLRAIENPEISLSNFYGNDKALVIKGSNGQSIIAPVHIDSTNNLNETSFVYRAEKVGASEITDAPIKSAPIENAPIVETAPTVAKTPKAVAPIKAEKTAPTKKVAPIKSQDVVKESQTVVKPSENVANDIPTDSNRKGKVRKFSQSAVESDLVEGRIDLEDLKQEKIYYEPISNKKSLEKANKQLESMEYDKAIEYFNSRFNANDISLTDVVVGERLIQEALARDDLKNAGQLIENVAILGTELGRKVQALSIIKKLSPMGQSTMLKKVINRAKTKGDKAFDGVEFTDEMRDEILSAYDGDGITFDQDKLNAAVESVKSKIADKMKTSVGEKLTAWRYLSMLGNPKTHGRNIISNVANMVTTMGKNAIAKTTEDILAKKYREAGKGSPFEYRTKTWKAASKDVLDFARETTKSEKDVLTGNKYSNVKTELMRKRKIFNTKVLQGVYDFNSKALETEDWWFKSFAYKNALAQFLTANGIKTKADIQNNKKLVEKAKQYATEQALIATFQQESWTAEQIAKFESKNLITKTVVGAVLPFKKTPINVAKTALSYSPIGLGKTLTYDIAKVKSGEMNASTLIDHIAQNTTGSALVFIGYLLASKGILNGAGDEDKEAKYDYQLGEQSYSINIGGDTYSLSWLSPTAMPLFVGVNMFEQFESKRELNGDVALQTLAQVLDPMSDMSFLSSLNDALSSYDSGVEKFFGIGKSMAQNYITQYIPTALSQTASAFDTKKRSTKASGDSGFEFGDETMRKIMYKIPALRNLLEPTTDIWGNDVKQTENSLMRALESYILPYSKRNGIETDVDTQIKELYNETGEDALIPSIPYDNIKFKGVKYDMSAKNFTEFKQDYGQTAHDTLEDLFATDMYKNADDDEKVTLIKEVYEYARDEAKRKYLNKRMVKYTNTTEDNVDVYRENYVKGAIDKDMPLEEYKFTVEYPEKYKFFTTNGITYDDYANADEDGKEAYTWAYNNPEKYVLSQSITSDVKTYKSYTKALSEFKADEYANGKTVSGSRKKKVINYINGLDIDDGAKVILYKSEYPSDDDYNVYIVNHLNSRNDISASEMKTILTELGFNVSANGRISW